jgi:hypothetical protein
MNRDEAKYILRSFHLNGLDTDDPQFQAALEMIQHDPELREWFSTEQVLDQKLSDAFRAFPVPPALQRELLAARNVVPPAAWWRQPVWMSVAASLALLGVLSVLLSRSSIIWTSEPAIWPKSGNGCVHTAHRMILPSQAGCTESRALAVACFLGTSKTFLCSASISKTTRSLICL